MILFSELLSREVGKPTSKEEDEAIEYFEKILIVLRSVHKEMDVVQLCKIATLTIDTFNKIKLGE